MIKYNNVHVRRCFLTAFMILFLLSAVVAKTRIMLISDPHVMGPGLLIKKGDAWEDAIYYDRKLTEYTRDIYDEMIAVALREKPDLFLISGDLTKDGEMVSHEYVAEKLQLLKQAGIKPFVIPGNHDLGTDEACYYDGGYCDNVLDVADANSFAELYRDFGYGDDVERDEHSLSWSCEPVDGLVLIGLDTGQDDTELNGCISEFTIGWLFNQAMDAKQRGKQVIVMMHHSLFPHIVKVDECNATYSVRLAMKMLNDDAYIYHDYTYVLGRLAYAGVPVVFSGHVHASDIAKDVMSGSSVFDISTASCASFPNPYRMLTLSDDLNTMRIQTYRITELPGLDNFAALSVILGVGLGSGNQILVAHLVGAHDFVKANRRVYQTLAVGVASGLLLSIIVALLGEHLLRLYTDNPEVLRLGKICLWCDVAVQPFKAVNFILTTSLRAAGDSKFPAIVGSGMMWTLGLATSLILAFVVGLGLPGLWLGMASDEFYRSFANIWRWRSGRWKSKAVV